MNVYVPEIQKMFQVGKSSFFAYVDLKNLSVYLIVSLIRGRGMWTMWRILCLHEGKKIRTDVEMQD